ncbi:PAS domain-containing methyl-accepting chemotaxis protein [Photobacterium sp.]|uniref:methyl-accepting chemotaxis protein n=1 Tax=Photobacterium sp. TaxID=660 RepID=UPI00299DACB5|nr:PAS domain-containing methyl-accepting chemotaxis protein [Photobacterium sp.]MDX1302912.1 PAS domain-containing methyl-accepting chemotaxis protein [Photobacterium sp.]
MTLSAKQSFNQTGEKEVEYSSGINIISTTDPQSHITYINQHFCDVAGFQPGELDGEPHNVIRHADMPKAAFAQLWKYIKSGKSWMGVMKNHCKNGDFYWVSAFVTPITNDKGQVIEYQSVRSKPDRDAVQRATDLYQKLNNGKTSNEINRPRFRQNNVLCGLMTFALILLAAQMFLNGATLWTAATIGILLSAIAVSIHYQSRVRHLTTLAKEAYDNPLMEHVYTGKKDDVSIIELALKMRQAEVRAIVGRASETAGDILMSAEDEFAQTKQIKTNLAKQSEATVQVGVAMAQMSSSIREVAESAAQASTITSDALQMSVEGQRSVETTINSVNSLYKELDNSKHVITALSESSRQIEGILDVIGSIADQTNLLALNAAIEAARAGEAGRGFAVVADEVRSLAQKTQLSTGEIQKMIAHLQQTASQAVDSVERGGALSEQCNQQAAETGGRLEQIHEMLNRVTDSSQQIASSVEDQAGVSDEISLNVQNIRQLTSETSETSDLSVESTRMLVERIEAMKRLMDQFQRV